jgi:ABC-type transport system involved in multi-copper enzyme maturation permease subunit
MPRGGARAADHPRDPVDGARQRHSGVGLGAPQPDAAPQSGPDTTNPLVLGILLFVLIGGLATGTGAIILMQGAVIDEKKSGTAEWILSKPVSRSAFIWAKLCATGLAALLIMIVLQGVVAYLLVSARLGNAPPLIPFASGIALLGLHLLFYLALTLMLGTLFDGRGPVLGIPLGILFGAQIVMRLAPWLVQFMPWLIIIPAGQNTLSLAMLAAGPARRRLHRFMRRRSGS